MKPSPQDSVYRFYCQVVTIMMRWSILPNPPSIGGCKCSVIDTSPGQELLRESGSEGACLSFPLPTHAAGLGVSKPTAWLGSG